MYVIEHYVKGSNILKLPAKILIVDDDQDILVAGKLLLKRHYSQVDICNRPEQLPILLADCEFDLILLDMNFGPGESSGEQGFYWLSQILKLRPDSIVILITAHGGIDIAVEAIKQGATDFIAKPWHNEKVLATISTSLELHKSRQETKSLRAANQALVQASTASAQHIIGNSSAMQQVHELVNRAAPTDANVLILGENGTGKELIAKELHLKSVRAQQVFLSVDLGAITETLFESELFGHKKGAFTGAQQDRVGKIKAADGGTLFLDEIGNLPLHLQAKLLTVLAQRKVTPVGANQEEAFDVRIIAATNVDRHSLLDEEKFRQDLLFRLNTVEITLPPLRERNEDIAAIAQHYIEIYSKKYNKPPLILTQNAIEALTSYHWPGNVRALRHAIERAVIMADNQNLLASDFQLSHANVPTMTAQTQKTVSSTVYEAVELNLDIIERQTISRALKQYKYNISHAAKALGLTRAALYRRMDKHGL